MSVDERASERRLGDRLAGSLSLPFPSFSKNSLCLAESVHEVAVEEDLGREREGRGRERRGDVRERKWFFWKISMANEQMQRSCSTNSPCRAP